MTAILSFNEWGQYTGIQNVVTLKNWHEVVTDSYSAEYGRSNGGVIMVNFFSGFIVLALPITLGAALVKVPALLQSTADTGPVLAGMLAAAVAGFAAIRLLLAYVRVRDYKPFVYYRFAFALLVWGILLVRRAQLG